MTNCGNEGDDGMLLLVMTLTPAWLLLLLLLLVYILHSENSLGSHQHLR